MPYMKRYGLAIHVLLLAVILAISDLSVGSGAYAQQVADGRVVADSALRAANPAALRRPVDTAWDQTNYETAFRPANHRGAPKALGVSRQGLQSAGGDRRDTPGSSNFQIVAPVLALPGRGMDLTLTLTYNSNLWHLQGNRISYDIDGDWPAPGWSLGFGKLAITPGGNILYGPDGTRHQLTRTVDPNNAQRFTGRSKGGGAFIDYDYVRDATGQLSYGTVRYPNGLEVSYGAQTGSSIYPVSMVDSNGNLVSIAYRNNAGPQIEAITDTAGRVMRFHYDANELLTAITGPADRPLVRLHYTNRNIDPDFGRLRKDVPGNVWLIDAIYYPGTRQGYWFGDSDSYSVYGMIAKVSEQRQLQFSASSLNDQGDVRPSGVSTGTHPSAARNADGRLEVPVRGSDGEIYQRWQTAPNNGWTDSWANFGGPFRGAGDPVIAQNADGRLERFVRASNNIINHMCQTSPNSGWIAGWVPLGSQPMAGDAALALNTEGRLEAFARGSDGWMYQTWQVRAPRECAPDRDWNNTWARMGNQQMAGDPAVARNVEGRLELAARGIDDRLYLTWQVTPNGGWTNTWMPLGGERFAGNPALARHSDGRLEVLVRGTDGIIYGKRQKESLYAVRQQCMRGCERNESACRAQCARRPPQEKQGCFAACDQESIECVDECNSRNPDLSWTNNWVAVGGQRMAGNPVLVEGVNGRLTALARGHDGRVYRIRQTDPDSLGRRGWEQGWAPLGPEQMFGDPSAVMNADGRLEVFAIGTDGAVHHIWQVQADGGWVRGWSPFSRQGIAGERLVARERAYNYPLSPAALRAPPTYTAMTETWARMDTPPVTTRYAVRDLTGNLSGRQAVTIIYADGTIIEQVIDAGDSSSAGLPLWEVVTDAQARELLRTTYLWEDGDYESRRLQGTIERIEGRGVNLVRCKAASYDARHNQLTDVREYDYVRDGEDCNRNLLRRTHTDYLDDPAYRERHIFNLPTATAVYEGDSNTPVALTEYRYDEYDQQPLLNASGVAMHSAAHDPYNASFDPRMLRRGNITQVTRYGDAAGRAGPVTELRKYDITGNMVSRSGTCCVEETTQFSRDYQYAYPTELVRGDPNPSGSARVTSSATYDFNTGLLLNSRDASGRETWRSYDPVSLRPNAIVYPTSAAASYYPILRFVYSESGELVVDESLEVQRNPWQTDVATRTHTRLNGLDRPWRVSVFAKDRWNHVETRYDVRGRVSQQTRPFVEGDPSPPWQKYEYDALGRLTRTVAPDGAEVQRIFYNEVQRPEAAQGRPGQTMRTIDAWGRERWTRADALDRLAEVIEPKADGGGSVFEPGHMSTRYYYNALDQVSEIEHGAQWHGYVYDSLGRLIRQRLPEKDWTLNEVGQFIGGGRTGIFSDVFAYDTRGNLISHVDARGIRTIRDYRDDPLGRLQETRYDISGFGDAGNPIVPASTARYYYEPTGDLTKLRAVTTDEVAEEYFYYQQGLLSRKTITWSNQRNAPAQIDYTYDAFDRLTDIRYPAQVGVAGTPRSVVHRDFAPGGPLNQFSINGEPLARPLSYSPNGSIRDLSVGDQASPVNESYDYDSNYGFLVGQRISRGTNALLDLSYNYARDGRVTGQVTRVDNNLDGSALQNRTYGYDALGRLVSSYFGGPAEREAWVHRYDYDSNGNRTRSRAYRCVRGFSCILSPPTELPADWRDGIDGLTYATENNRITNAGFAYDAAGNLRRGQRPDGSWQNYQYDAAGRLAVVTYCGGAVLEYAHYGDNRRRAWVESRIPGSQAFRTTYYAWSGNQILAEFSAVPSTGGRMSWARNYAYLGDRLLATQSREGTRFHHPDRLGTRLMTDANGTVISQHNPFAFGTERETPSSASSGNRFTTYDRSAVTGLDYAVNRYYAPQQGRFLQPDPLGLAAGRLDDPQSLNLYAYVRNDPVNRTDPIGLVDSESCVGPEGESLCEVIIVTPPERGPLTPPNVPGSDPDENAREISRADVERFVRTLDRDIKYFQVAVADAIATSTAGPDQGQNCMSYASAFAEFDAVRRSRVSLLAREAPAALGEMARDALESPLSIAADAAWEATYSFGILKEYIWPINKVREEIVEYPFPTGGMYWTTPSRTVNAIVPFLRAERDISRAWEDISKRMCPQ